MKYGNQGTWKKIISSPFIFVGLLILFIFLTKAVWGIREKNALSNSRLSSAQSELQRLETHQKDLTTQIDYLSTERGIEAELRTKYRAIREGESVAVIVDDDQTASAVESASTSIVNNNKKNGWLDKVFGLFGF